jgi:hypothetical protein
MLNYDYENSYAWETAIPIISYGKKYFEIYTGLKNTRIANKLNLGRVKIVNDIIGKEKALDIGIGSGEFIENRKNTYGYDINLYGIAWLKERKLYYNFNKLLKEKTSSFLGITFWDSFEHILDIKYVLSNILIGMTVFLSIPIFSTLKNIKKSKHYKPGEHIHYFTMIGLVEFFKKYGFKWIKIQTFEIEAGRDSIYTFAFKKEKYIINSQEKNDRVS